MLAAVCNCNCYLAVCNWLEPWARLPPGVSFMPRLWSVVLLDKPDPRSLVGSVTLWSEAVA